MAEFNFSVDDRNVMKALNRVEALGRSFRKPLERAGLYVLRETDKRFQAERAPSGEKWKSLTDSTKQRRRKGKKSRYGERILQDTGTLRNSLSSKRHPNNIFKIEAHSVDVGTNVPYANIHQFGFSGVINKKAGHIKVTHRLNKDKSRFLKQKGHPNLLVFAKKSHKNVMERIFKRKAYSYNLNIPARPFLGITDEDKEQINRIFLDWADVELKKSI